MARDDSKDPAAADEFRKIREGLDALKGGDAEGGAAILRDVQKQQQKRDGK